MNVAVTAMADTKISALSASHLLLSDLPRDLGALRGPFHEIRDSVAR
jgi:hypothetical protein